MVHAGKCQFDGRTLLVDPYNLISEFFFIVAEYCLTFVSLVMGLGKIPSLLHGYSTSLFIVVGILSILLYFPYSV